MQADIAERSVRCSCESQSTQNSNLKLRITKSGKCEKEESFFAFSFSCFRDAVLVFEFVFGFRISNFLIRLAFVWRFGFGILEWLLSPLLYL